MRRTFAVPTSGKGVLVIPKKVREQLGMHPGDVINLELREGTAILTKPEHI